jgi:hypothetical protein
MTKDRKAAVNDVSKSQAQRFLEAARAKQVNGSGQNFSQAMGKNKLRRDGRKTAGRDYSLSASFIEYFRGYRNSSAGNSARRAIS